MAEENQEEVVKKSGGGKGLIIVLAVLIVVLLLGMGFLGYVVYSKVLNADPNAAAGQAKQEVVDEDQTYKVAINDLVLNITNAKGREKLMKLSFSLKSTESSIESIVEKYKPEIVDAVITQISSRSSEELLTVGGKALLKEELIDDINNIINEVTADNEDIKKNNVKNIFFTTFVIK